MAYSKTKNAEAAQKFLHQGKTAQAIAEYQNILKHEPKDQVTLMTVGDLYVRQGETFQALEYFERLAQIFLSDGFVTKAIAIYKKIAKLAPEENRPVERLAELYIQQGVLSEARPIYLQLAEMHQRAGRYPQAAALLRKLLDAEPENLRVLTQLAELLQASGQTAEASVVNRAAAEQLHRRGDNAEAIKYVDRALEANPGDESTTMLKAVALSASGKRAEAVELLKSLPQLDAGGKASDQLLDLYLEAGEREAACDLVAKIFARNAKHFAPAHRVATALLEAGEADRALLLIDVIREAMTDAGEHEALSQSLQRAAERLPKRIEPREWLVELYGRTSDSFRMADALADLAAVCETAGQHDRARQVYEQLLDRDPENESARRKHEQAKAAQLSRTAGTGRVPAAAGPGGVSDKASDSGTGNMAGNATVSNAASNTRSGVAPPSHDSGTANAQAQPPAENKFDEPPLDEQTQQFVTQSLTDVDLFSSYGLTQKAIDLLEVVLQRAPRHTASIERLLDLYLGAGNERRTAELASQLQEIYTQRNDPASADRFAELRRRYERAAGMNSEQATPVSQAAPPEFSVPVVEAEPIPEPESFADVASPADTGTVEMIDNFSTVEPGVHEVDLSEEWAALAGFLSDEAPPKAQENVPEIAATPEAAERADQPSETSGSIPEPELPHQQEPAPQPASELSPVPEPVQAFAVAMPAEIAPAPEEAAVPELGLPEMTLLELPHIPEEIPHTNSPEFSLELEPVPETNGSGAPAMDADSFLSSLSSELDDAVLPAWVAAERAPQTVHESSQELAAVSAAAEAPQTISAQAPSVEGAASAPSSWSTQSSGPLGDVFDQFKADMGETAAEDEDLETHYNLGIAYREMGLLEEAISEFQKVAKANSQGHAFRYSMQCCTLLGLAFMDKGQAGIAAMWYERALDTPGLDQESILALRYDLGVAQQLAGEMAAARKSFSQVYGMNIDYRDVAERLGALGKGS
jgi:pilus assembly protein FimV